MKIEEVKIGQRVKSLVEFCDVPVGTEGIIDELYSFERDISLDETPHVIEGDGFMVCWNAPKNYVQYDGKPACFSHLIRDGMSVPDELKYLEVVN